ncbi:MAG: site-specific integrase [Polyangia bacterium]
MSQIRIEGPYQHGSGWRCRLVLAGRRMWCRPSAPSPEAARQIAEGAARAAAQHGGMTVREAGDAYLLHLRASGARELTLSYRDRDIRQFFGDVLGEPLARLTPARCAALYEQLRTSPRERTGRIARVATQHTYLKESRRFLAFCVEEKWIKANPLDEIRAVGRKNKGKGQLRIDEARRFYAVCLEHARKGDAGAAAALVGLLMAFRPGEIDSRTVRDLDDGGAILWVDDTEDFDRKTESSRRPVQVPQVLRPILRELARDKVGAALLWPARDGRRHRHGWVNRQVERMCREADVPRVCAHSLRGLQATTALHAGATPELVASVLGHESTEMTLKHYAARGSAQAGDQMARVQLLVRKP